MRKGRIPLSLGLWEVDNWNSTTCDNVMSLIFTHYHLHSWHAWLDCDASIYYNNIISGYLWVAFVIYKLNKMPLNIIIYCCRQPQSVSQSYRIRTWPSSSLTKVHTDMGYRYSKGLALVITREAREHDWGLNDGIIYYGFGARTW